MPSRGSFHAPAVPATRPARRPRSLRAFAAVVACALAGCTVGPNYTRPVHEVPAQWRIDLPAMQGAADAKWWDQFQDPVLSSLVQTALENNLDVRIAAARIDQFAGTLTSTRSQFFPQVGYGAEPSRFRSSRLGVPPIPEPADPYFNLYQASLSASWQIDLFGRVRRQTEAVQAQVYASEEAKRGVVLTLVSTVTVSYVNLRALDRQLEIAQSTAGNLGESSRILHRRFGAGLVSQVEVSQVDSQYQQAAAAIPLFQRQIAAQENLICILLGREPGPIPRGKTLDQLAMPAIPAGLPSSLLERRPDIQVAEQNLVAANANVGVARSLYYPQLSLTGVLGSVSQAFGDFLTGPAGAWLLAAQLAGPIVTFGAIEGQVKSAEAQKDQATFAYRQVVLNAFRETNDALTGSVRTREQTEHQAARVVELREFARLSYRRFDRGLSGYLDVLVAETNLFDAELAAVSTQAQQYAQVVAVYQAMGGGWVDVANGMTPGPKTAAR